jgi:predicted secreted protein
MVIIKNNTTTKKSNKSKTNTDTKQINKSLINQIDSIIKNIINNHHHLKINIKIINIKNHPKPNILQKTNTNNNQNKKK